MSLDTPDKIPERHNPLDRLSAGGWRAGLARLSAGALVVFLVLYLSPGDALAVVLDPAVARVVMLGALVHVVQRAARIAKWSSMLRGGALRPRSLPFLLRIQFVGMLANLLLPVSEALKVWAVSRTRKEAVGGSESIVVDTAIHAAMVGGAGVSAIALHGFSLDTLASGVAVALMMGGISLVWAIRVLRGRSVHYQLPPSAFGWCVLETASQLLIYYLALNTIGVSLSLIQVVAFAPVLFLADLVMLTPSGIGLREGLFALVVAGQGASAERSVAVGLTVSAMLLLATLGAGAVALAVPTRHRGE